MECRVGPRLAIGGYFLWPFGELVPFSVDRLFLGDPGMRAVCAIPCHAHPGSVGTSVMAPLLG